MINKSHKILLIFPGNSKQDLFFPHSLLYISAYLLKAGYEVKIFDQRLENNWKVSLLNLLSEEPLWTGLSVMTGPQIKLALDLSSFIKNNSRSKIVWGGTHPTIFPDQVIENILIDFVVRKEGEITSVDLSNALINNTDLSYINGLTYKTHGRIYHNPDRDFINLNDCPPIPYPLIDVSKYFSNTVWFGDPATIFSSRGCPNNCTFCYNTVINKNKWRYLKPDKAFQEIISLINYTKKYSLIFLDDNFFASPKRVNDICDLILQHGLKISFQAEGRVDILNTIPDEYFIKFHKAGLKTIYIGAESGSDHILNQIKKGFTVKDIIKLNKKLKYLNIAPIYSFIIGLPWETRDDYYKTIELIKELINDNKNASIYRVNMFFPFPGCQIYHDSQKLGFRSPNSLTEWSNKNWSLSYNDFPWLKENKWKLKTIIYTSTTLKPFKFHMASNKLLKIFYLFYRPFSKFRWKNNLFFPFIDTLYWHLKEKYFTGHPD